MWLLTDGGLSSFQTQLNDQVSKFFTEKHWWVASEFLLSVEAETASSQLGQFCLLALLCQPRDEVEDLTGRRGKVAGRTEELGQGET